MSPAPAGQQPTRREVLGRARRVLAWIVGAECLGTAAIFLWPRKAPPAEGGYGGVVTAGPVDNFTPGQVTAFAKGQFYLSRLADGGFSRCRASDAPGCTVPGMQDTALPVSAAIGIR
jgi:hypothetical protein